MSHVFISHGSEDSSQATELCAFIEARGVRVWIAPRDVRPGIDYSEALQGAIEACAAFVVLVTEEANTSPYVRAETEMAFSNSKPIFPVRLADVKPAAGLAFFLKIRHWTDAYGKSREANLDRLAIELQRLGGVAPGPAAAAAPPPAPAAPPPPPAAQAAAAVPADEELLAAAIGPNADWYLARWRKMDEKKRAWSWSWAACFLYPFWMAYRKMWLWLALLIGANVVLGVAGAAGPLIARITLFATIGLSFVTGYFAVGWYRKQIAGLVAATAGLDREAARAQLRGRGGVSKPALLVAIGIAALMVLLALAGVLLQAQQMLKQEELRQQHLRAHENALRDAAPADEEPPPAEDAEGL